ncbi:hypothetical protein [Mycobacteroides abscessus]|uniref:hypothetical protein n=1 Tax=Mycobacteroides abscessus TaxID=36809 RepID=UPI00092CA583|nr:hypothetical protein [Mycobacteroides abscessus]SHP23922.1 Uncharacterised protein [Mycobacteroides abscessus subsp. abscessus]SHP97599.1 Uncharacterised protein [Mycobacteroides abscessus subsp. abscessus]SHR52420.1 Uncharacterised protein [Mycobacteroides abscessus subsp. abscessus]SHS25824.1 Uncharacterised protein [Mycobacteroides abscessus subsp. abscessus]SHS48701.1 Uncharacterised protein [Mycobacteroides abscessus subsp. abscessus]
MPVDLVEFPDLTALARVIALQELAARGITGIGIGSGAIGGKPLPQRYIRLHALPGTELCRRVQSVMIVGQVYDTNEIRGFATASKLGAILRAAPEIELAADNPVTEPCELHGPYPSTDPDLPTYARYQVNVRWTVQSSITA